MVHGADELARAERASKVLFGGSLAEASVADILMVFDDVQSVTLAKAELERLTATELVTSGALAASKGEATRLIKQGGIYVNDRRVTDERAPLTLADAIGGQVIVVRKGQRERRVVRIRSRFEGAGMWRLRSRKGLTSIRRSPTFGGRDLRDVLGLERRAARASLPRVFRHKAKKRVD